VTYQRFIRRIVPVSIRAVATKSQTKRLGVEQLARPMHG